ncbi:hypothetical protein ABMA67_00590 [Halobacteriovorax sp. RZ-3]|uniref:hypothetical protein n=1 Tax=Halobacteriovorax sp. RZ-3 TaxID=3157720 RepID=UPI003711B20F
MKSVMFNDSYLNEILEEVFLSEELSYQEDNLAFIISNSIYDVCDDVEVSRREDFESSTLNEEGPDIEDLDALEEIAVEYFKSPTQYYVPVESEERRVVCYVQFLDGVSFSSNGEASEKWRSLGVSFEVSIEEVTNYEGLIERACSFDICWSKDLRIVIYGDELEILVGSKCYLKDEKKQLVELVEGDRSVMLAVPDYERISGKDKSLFHFAEERLNRSILCGGDHGLNRMLLSHYELTKSRLDEIKEEELERKSLLRLQNRERGRVIKIDSFNSKFKPYKELVKQINSGELLVKDLEHLDLIELRRIIYVAEKQGERIQDVKKYYLIKGMIKRKNALLIKEDPLSKEAFLLVERINNGEVSSLYGVEDNLIVITMNLLWSKSGIRIEQSFKEIYFEMKSRYMEIVKNSKVAA